MIVEYRLTDVAKARWSRGVAGRRCVVPLTQLQRELLANVARNRPPDSYLASDAAIHIAPQSLLELMKRRGHVRPEDIARLQLARPFDIVAAKRLWLAALVAAAGFIERCPVAEFGCLYYSTHSRTFVLPAPDNQVGDVVPHFGRPGGVLPQRAG